MKQGCFRSIIKPIRADNFMDTLDVAFRFAAAPAGHVSNEHIT